MLLWRIQINPSEGETMECLLTFKYTQCVCGHRVHDCTPMIFCIDSHLECNIYYVKCNQRKMKKENGTQAAMWGFKGRRYHTLQIEASAFWHTNIYNYGQNVIVLFYTVCIFNSLIHWQFSWLFDCPFLYHLFFPSVSLWWLLSPMNISTTLYTPWMVCIVRIEKDHMINCHLNRILMQAHQWTVLLLFNIQQKKEITMEKQQPLCAMMMIKWSATRL